MKFIKNAFISLIFELIAGLVYTKNRQVLHTAITHSKNTAVGITTLVRHSDVAMLIVSLSSFFYYSKTFLPVHIIDDGSLTESDYRKLTAYFGATIKPLSESGKELKKVLRPYKHLARFISDERTQHIKHKFDALYANPFEKFIYLDADILFFAKPHEICRWVVSQKRYSLYSAHLPYNLKVFGPQYDLIGHSYRLLLFEKFKSKIDPTFNDGLLCIQKSQIDFATMNTVMDNMYKNLYAQGYLAQETTNSFMVKAKNYHKLPVKKYTNAWMYEQWAINKRLQPISMHYIYLTKKFYKTDAIKLALKTNFFKIGGP